MKLFSQLLLFLQVVIACVSGLATYIGASLSFAKDFTGHVIAAALAICSSMVLFMVWHTAFRAIEEAIYLETANRREVLRNTLLVVVLSMPVIFAMSSVFNIAGVAGRDAQVTAMIGGVHKGSSILPIEVERTAPLKALEPQLDIEAKQYWADADGERKTGAITGVPGPGATEAALKRIGNKLAELHRAVSTHLQVVEREQRVAQQLLQRMHASSISDMSIDDRFAQLSALSVQFRASLGTMNVRPVGESLIGVLDALPDEASDSGYQLSKSPKLAKAQRQAIAALKTKIEATVEKLRPVARRLAETDALDYEGIDRPSPITAPLMHFSSYWPAVVAAFGIDLSGGILWLMAWVLARRISVSERRRSMAEKMTNEEMLAAKMAEAQQKKFRVSDKEIQERNGEFFGMSSEKDHE